MSTTSWKTTSAGILAIIGALVGLFFAIKNKTVTAEVITGCVSGILVGVGLIVAKDGNVTGGTVSNGKVPPPVKMLILLVMLSGFGLAAQAQPSNVSFFKPVPKNLFVQGYTMTTPKAITNPNVWLLRPTAQVTAIELNWNKLTKTFDASALSSAGIGISYAHFVEQADGTPYNNVSLNALLLLGADIEQTQPTSLKLAVMGSAFGGISLGVDVDLKSGLFGILTGLDLKF
jgi:hypothetical protein